MFLCPPFPETPFMICLGIGLSIGHMVTPLVQDLAFTVSSPHAPATNFGIVLTKFCSCMVLGHGHAKQMLNMEPYLQPLGLYVKKRTHYIAQTSLELPILLSQFPVCWNNRQSTMAGSAAISYLFCRSWCPFFPFGNNLKCRKIAPKCKGHLPS